MSAWLTGPLAGPLAGPLVDGDLCEVAAGYRCTEPALVIAQNLQGAEVLLCEYHADRHGISPKSA